MVTRESRRVKTVVTFIERRFQGPHVQRTWRTPQRAPDGTQTAARLNPLLDLHSLFQRQFAICSHRNSLCQIGLGVARGV